MNKPKTSKECPGNDLTKPRGWVCNRCNKSVCEGPKKQEEFRLLVSEYLKHHSNRELADYCECIPSTITRWAEGKALPMNYSVG